MPPSTLELTVANVGELAHLRDEVGGFLRSTPARNRTDEVLLVASELVTNGLEHGSGDPVDITVSNTDREITLSVESTAAVRRPVITAGPPDPSESRGRGLFIARSLADSFTLSEDSTSVRIECTFAA